MSVDQKGIETMLRRLALLSIFLTCSIAAFAQQPAAAAPTQPVSDQVVLPKPLTALERYRQSKIPIYMNDYGQLARYRDANRELKPPAPGENRIVFFGDSITDGWKLTDYFPGKPYVNRGISGQTTPQMLVRFREDVIDLQPKAVVILVGTNDIAGNTGPMTLEQIEANYTSLAELASANQVKVIFSSVLPVNNYTPEAQEFFADRSPSKILELNRWLKSYCAAHGCIYLDYFGAMVDDKGLLKKELADDGLHPNVAGYKVMAPLAEAAIARALPCPAAH
jgi:lysophospholipase L1-like esterase